MPRGDLPLALHRGGGALKRELVSGLGTGRALRQPRARSRTARRTMSPRMSSSLSLPLRLPTARLPSIGKGASLSVPAAPRSAPSPNARAAQRSWCICRGGGLGRKPAGQGRSGARRLRGCRSERRVDEIHGGPSRSAAPIPHPGSRQGTVRAHPVRARHQHAGVLRRPTLSLRATDEREHQRTAALELPERNRPVQVVRRGPRSRRTRPEQPVTQDFRLEDPRRGLRGAVTLAATTRCCSEQIYSSNTPRSTSARPSAWSASSHRSVPSATPTTTPSPRPRSDCSRPSAIASDHRSCPANRVP